MELMTEFTTPTGAGASVFIPVPVKSFLLKAVAVIDGDPGDAKTFTFKSGSTTIGTLTFGSDVAAGDTAEYVPDATDKKTEVNRTTPIEVAIPQCDAAVKVRIVLEIDEYLRKVDAYN